MSLVLSLIAARSKDELSREEISRLAAILARGGARPAEPDWLSPREACDIPFQADAETALVLARGAFHGRAVDINAVPTTFRRKKLLLADMDSTLIEQECIDELAAEAGFASEVAALTEQAMRGEIGFEPALRARVALLRGLPVAAVERVLQTRISFTRGADVLVSTARAAGCYCALVSGGFSAFSGPIARQLGFDEHRSNELKSSDGVLTGEVGEPIFGRAAKEQALADLAERLRIDPMATLAVGDGANDAAMIRSAGLGVAYHAKAALKTEADAIIDHADLTAILFLQGFRRDEFAVAEVR